MVTSDAGMGFALDERLANDGLFIGDLALCRALLMNDSRFLWLVLVPRREGLVEWIDLSADDRARLSEEIALASAALKNLAQPDKINVGALGNIVRQLHIHVVARKIGDAAWPGPVWGSGKALPFEEGAACELVSRLKDMLSI